VARWTQQDRCISFAELPIVVGRSAECDLCLTEPTVSRRHAQLERAAGRLVVRDLESRYGTFVNGVKVVEKALEPGDRVRFGMQICYWVRADALEPAEVVAAGLVLDGVGIERGGRRLVENVGAGMQPGQLIGVLGPSGVGKTQLLRVMAGFFPPAAGQVLWHNEPIQAVGEEYLQQVGYIPQHDLLYDTLTVAENIAYAAELRLGRLSAAERAQRVEEVLELVQMSGHRHKPAAVLSGGQRKRVSVAVELLRRPAMLLLDEPTTGLDPANEARLLENLRQIAQQGTLVVCTSHSVGIVRMFDRVLVLAVQGNVARQAFWGRPENLLEGLGIREWADLYDMLEHGGPLPSADQSCAAVGAGALPGAAPAGQGQGLSGGAAADGDIGGPAGLPQEDLKFPSPDSVPLGREFLRARRRAHQGQSAGWAAQCWRVGWRCLTMTRRDALLSAMMIGQPLALGLLVVLTQYNPGRADPIFFFTVVIAIWLGLNNSVRDLVRERRQYLRDRLAGMQVEAYLGAKIGLFLAIGLVQVALLTLVVRWGAKGVLGAEAEHVYKDLAAVGWLAWIGVGMLVYACGLGLGLLISTLARTEEAAVAALPLLMLPQILLSAVATGDVKTPVTQPRAFLPVVATLRAPPGGRTSGAARVERQELGAVRRLVDVLSLACYSRPALLTLAPVDLSGKGYSKRIWWGDLLHLLVLLTATYGALWVGFLHQEDGWPRRIGI